MTYEYNAKAHYAPYGKHEELITGEDLTQLKIVVRDDNAEEREFFDQSTRFNLRLGRLQVSQARRFLRCGGFSNGQVGVQFPA